MAAFEFSPNNEAGVPLYTFGDAVRVRKKTPKDFAAACGISVVRARRLLKGGFIPNSLDVHAIAKLLDYDTRTVIALRKQHNERYHLQSDRGTVWSVPSDDVAGAEMTSGRTTFDALGTASNIARDAQTQDYQPPDFSVEPSDVQEAKFRWIYLGCADSITITELGHDLRRSNKSIASDLESAIEDVKRKYAEIEAKFAREHMEKARAAFAESG